MKYILSLSRAVFFPAVLVTSSLFLVLILIPQVSYAAAVETVINTNDVGAGSLRDAIANVDSGGTVNFNIAGPAPHTITLASQITIDESMTINGPGADMLTISGNNSVGIFNIDDGNAPDIVVSISGLRFINGFGAASGAIVNAEELSIDSCVFENNGAEAGGAIINIGTIVEINNSTFSGNIAIVGGAIINIGTIVEINTCTFSGNSAFSGGAIFNTNTITSITNCTFDGNMAFGGSGGAIWSDGTINISFTTIANNEADNEGGGIFEAGLSVNIRNSIVAFNTDFGIGDNCNGAIAIGVNEINNYSNDASCGFGVGDNSNILLGPLADNGGPTETLALISGAPLNGASAMCDPLNSSGMPSGVPLLIDQRFFPRPSPPGGDCDSGAFERQLIISNVPTLSEWGLIAMAGILGIAGFLVMRRRKVTA